MNSKRILGCIIIIIIILISIFNCKKKEDTIQVKEESAIVAVKQAPLYAEAGASSAVKNLTDGVKLVCLNRDNPQSVETIKEVNEDGATRQVTESVNFYQVKLVNSDDTGWMSADSIAFRDEEPAVAFILEETYVYYVLDKGTDKVYKGDTVKYLGYKIKHDWEKYKWKDVEMWRIQVGDKECWIRERSVIANAATGIILEDVDLFKQKIDRSENINGSLKKMDIVPVLDKGDDGWITIVKDYRKNEFYISAALGNPVSYQDVDLTIVSYLKDHYYTSKAIIEEVDKAYETSDPVAEVTRIEDKESKIEKLGQAKTEIDEKIAKYSTTSFKTELSNMARDITEVINILESNLRENDQSSGGDQVLEAEVIEASVEPMDG